MTTIELGELVEEISPITPRVTEIRRSIHSQPELGLENPLTQELIAKELSDIGYEPVLGSSITSVVAELDTGREGPTLLLRADTDALPMTEESGEPFASEIEGRAHSCGHDAHVAMLLGAARVLWDRKDELVGRVRFAFQPGEEGFGGAAVMIEDGLMEGVDAAFAIHVSPNIPLGFVASRPGPLMASTDDFKVTISGKGTHASTPHFGNDPVPVAAETVGALQSFVTRRVDAFNPAVITVGRIEAGTTSNVIPQDAEMEGTIRTVSDDVRAAVTSGFERVVSGVSQAHDCSAHIEMRTGYPVTVNNAEFVKFASGVVTEVMGEGHYFELPTPIMGAEDFSYMLQKVPGAMVFLGVCPDDIENSLEAPSCHSNLMRLNEAALGHGVALHVGVALRYCYPLS